MVAAVLVAVSLVGLLTIAGGLALVWRKRVTRRRNETVAERYRRDVSRIRQLSDDNHPDDARIWPAHPSVGPY